MASCHNIASPDAIFLRGRRDFFPTGTMQVSCRTRSASCDILHLFKYLSKLRFSLPLRNVKRPSLQSRKDRFTNCAVDGT